jgi:hypothetical protein
VEEAPVVNPKQWVKSLFRKPEEHCPEIHDIRNQQTRIRLQLDKLKAEAETDRLRAEWGKQRG